MNDSLEKDQNNQIATLRVAVGQLETRVGRIESDVENLKSVQNDIHTILMSIQNIENAQEAQALLNKERAEKDEQRDKKLNSIFNNKLFISGVVFGLSIVLAVAYDFVFEVFKTYIKS